MLWPENPRLILCIKEIDSISLKVLCRSGVFAAKKNISLSFTESKEGRRDKGGVLISAVL
jgi:hypothetical protein